MSVLRDDVFTRKAGAVFVLAEARSPLAIDEAFAALGRARVGAVVVKSDAMLNTQRQQIGEIALRERLSTIFSQHEYVDAGGLMAYGDRLFEFFRRSAHYGDRIFKGAKPAELPVEQPTQFYLTINLKTAKALGIIIPESILVRATR